MPMGWRDLAVLASRAMRRSSLALVLILAAGCASNAKVRTLETRLAAVEAAHTRRTAEAEAARLELETKLVALRLEVQRLSAADDRTAELVSRIEKLERMDRPPPRPSRPAPDPAAVYAVPVAGLPAEGPDDALVTVVRAGEYACPYCEKVRPTLAELRRLYGDKLRLVYVSFVVHPQVATIPAQAVCAAHRQHRFWEMDELMWERVFKARAFDQPTIEGLATELGLDLDRFRADLAGPCVADVQAQMAMLSRFGIGATPGFFINGRFLSGAQPLPAFQGLIDEELAKAVARVAGKKPRKRKLPYYEEWVMGTGLKQLAPPTPPTPAPTPIAVPGGAP